MYVHSRRWMSHGMVIPLGISTLVLSNNRVSSHYIFVIDRLPFNSIVPNKAITAVIGKERSGEGKMKIADEENGNFPIRRHPHCPFFDCDHKPIEVFRRDKPAYLHVHLKRSHLIF